MSDIERELSWDDEIEKDGGEFPLLPEGDYDFTVKSFQRGRHSGSEKLPPCNKAELTITILGQNESVDIKHNLFLHSKVEGMLSAFFTAIGQKKHGEKLKMNWNAVVGAKGKCHVYVDKYTGKNGTKYTSNKIKKFYTPDADITTVSPQPKATETSSNQWSNASWS